MFDFNNGFGYPQPQYQFMTAQPQAMPKRNNVLTDEEIKKLQSNRTQFTLTITEDEHLRGVCNHRTADGMNDALEYDPSGDGSVVCKICGQKFKPVNPETSPEGYVEQVTEDFINMLQTIKLMFVDIPTDAARQFFDIIPMAAKAPELFSIASKNLSKYENGYNAFGYNGASPSAMGLLNNFMGMVGSNQPFNGIQGAQPQPVYQQTQMGNPNPAFNPNGNPFGYPGSSNPQTFGYQPGTTGFQYNPQQAAPQGQPQAAPATDAGSSTTTTTTNTQA